MKITRSREEQKKTTASSHPLAGKVAIVTGASSGIGAATAWELAQQGAQVVLAARRVNKLEEQAGKISAAGCHAVAMPMDVTDAAQVTRLIEQVVERFGRVDILVNNAGVAWTKPFETISMEKITQVVNVNLLGVALMTSAVLPGMLERRHGTIISVSSVAGHMAVDPLYSATKFGVRAFSLSLRRELAGRGVSVSVVSPGFIRTAMSRNFRLPMPGPELVARAIARLVVHPRREIVVPGYYRPLIAAEHAFPWLADLAIRQSRPRIEAKK